MIGTLKVAINMLFQVLEFAIIVDALLSWVYRGKGNVFIDILHSITEPFLIPAKKLQDRFVANSMMDFSPIIALLFLDILQKVLYSILGMFA